MLCLKNSFQEGLFSCPGRGERGCNGELKKQSERWKENKESVTEAKGRESFKELKKKDIAKKSSRRSSQLWDYQQEGTEVFGEEFQWSEG